MVKGKQKQFKKGNVNEHQRTEWQLYLIFFFRPDIHKNLQIIMNKQKQDYQKRLHCHGANKMKLPKKFLF